MSTEAKRSARSDNQRQILLRVDLDMKQWLESEKDSSGRSINWLVNHALTLWKNRVENGRKSQTVAPESQAASPETVKQKQSKRTK